MSPPLRPGRGGVLLALHAQPGARRDEVAGLHGDRLRVRTTAPPADGKANERLLALVAAAFGLRRRDVELVSGATSRRKDVLLSGLDLPEAEKLLAAALAGGAS